MLEDTFLVLKREGDILLLPTRERLDGIVTTGIPHTLYTMCRVISHDNYTGEMILELMPHSVNHNHYRISTTDNSSQLLSLNIKKLIIRTKAPHSFALREQNSTVTLNASATSVLIAPNQQEHTANLVSEEPPIPKEITNIPIDLPVKDMQFEEGKICFEYYVKPVSRKVRFEVENPFIKKEYDSIKNYIAKALGVKKFPITLYIESIHSRVLKSSATSALIEQIDDTLFELVEELYLEASFISNPEDEVYVLIERAAKSAKETGSEKMLDTTWLLNKLITQSKTKHYYHLRYLSSKHLSEEFNLRLTGKPLSFIFLIPNENNYCVVWETYATQEATYLWKLERSDKPTLQKQVMELIATIKWLRRNNKSAYLQRKPENFRRIEHDYGGDDMGFNKWKAQLEEFLSGKEGNKVKGL